MKTVIEQTYIDMWRYLFFFWRNDFQAEEKVLAAISKRFCDNIPIPTNLMLNILSFELFYLILLMLCGFSDSFLIFNIKFVCLPAIVGSFSYYYYKYGVAAFHCRWPDFFGWVRNAMLVTSCALVSWTMLQFFYLFPLLVEKLFLPYHLHCEMNYNLEMMETTWRHYIYMVYGMGFFSLVTFPVWVKGFSHCFEVLGRPSVQIGKFEICMDIMFLACQAPNYFQFVMPVSILLPKYFGIKYRIIHALFLLVVVITANYSSKLKGLPFHRMLHAIKPLYLKKTCSLLSHISNNKYII